jgi:hypothetical protein
MHPLLLPFPPLNCPRAKALSPTKQKASLDSRLRLAIAKPFFRPPFPHFTNHYPYKHTLAYIRKSILVTASKC